MRLLLLLGLSAVALFAAGESLGLEAKAKELNIPAIVMFFIFVGATLGITYWAASKTKSASDFVG